MVTKKVSLVLVTSSLAEASELMIKIGCLERELATLSTDLEATIAAARTQINTIAGPIEKKRDEYLKSLKDFATKNRRTLLAEDKKSLTLPGGEFGWRTTPTKVTYSKGDAEQAIKNLQSLNLTAYLRILTEVDREALLRDRPAVSGIRYTQTEKFYVKPESTKTPETFPGEPNKK
jgi:phage host-nuclease inhibitor protein Gam